ncbi:dienelactone hydrolase [Kibdelosporangium banguiense]|uniref:Dienelactone hydrolase n=1 Tax=Kibdelosporangium banguiense TaxID=1365924 RepID=A0ABS4TYI2_9PSEU|nr:alpha/beta hydrolase [Kibdelosporangium banguiense]MBP2329455.1 dienelactone hydrolase [Kibdelosporangium banguiense]
MNDTTPTTRRQPPKAVIVMRAVPGAAAVVMTIAVAIIAWSALVASHPAYPVLLGAIGIAGVVLLVRCVRPRRTGRLRTVGRIAGVVILVLVLAVVAYLRPFPANDAGVVAAASTDTVEVSQRWDAWELRPRGKASTVGVVFLPGMLVDPRAYFPLLTPLVECGARVVVPTAPLGMALNGAQATAQAIEAAPDIGTWVVGGYSMGGNAAVSVAADNPDIDGLLIWASYPTVDMSKSDVAVISVYGTNDPFANTGNINDSRALLPADTRYVAVEGGVHAHFGDYTQPDDGAPGIDRATAERQIMEATVSFVESLRQD